MENDIADRLCEAFDRALDKDLSIFRKSEGQVSEATTIYAWKPSDGVSIFLSLVLSPNMEAFTWEAAWSVKHTFPFHLYPMSPLGNERADIPPAAPVDGEFRFRIPELWDVGKDSWWHVGNSGHGDNVLGQFDRNVLLPSTCSDDQINSVVDSAISRIRNDAMPFVRTAISKMLGKEVF